MSRTRLLASLRGLQQERRRLLRRLARDHELAVGTVSVLRRKCGNPACHCAYGPGHLQTLFLFTGEDGRRQCKLVRRADERRLLRAGAHYREFRQDLNHVAAINQREKQILMALKELRALHYE